VLSGFPYAYQLSDEEQLPTVSPIRARTRELDEACAQAVDLARAAAQEVADAGQVGAYVGAGAEGDRVVTHLFACLDPAYTGWQWAVTVTRAARSKSVTVSESVLLPGPDSLLAPDWVPWSNRVRPGDLRVGDLLPAGSDDERLVPVVVLQGDDGVLDWDDSSNWNTASGLWAAIGVPAPAGQAAEAGADADADAASRVGPARVLSAIGRDTTALRWYSSERGPGAPLANAAPGSCATCGFLIRLGGPLGRVFGACANEFAPDDGRVVSVDHGCGAHSDVVTPTGSYDVSAPIEEIGFDLVDAPGVSMADTVFESLDHTEQ
jgi:hypothetical protein